MARYGKRPVLPCSCSPEISFTESINSYKAFVGDAGSSFYTSLAQIKSLKARGKGKSLILLLPVRIRCGDALPELGNCMFTFLVLNRQLPMRLQKAIESLSEDEKDNLHFDLLYHPPAWIVEFLAAEHEKGCAQFSFNAVMDVYVKRRKWTTETLELAELESTECDETIADALSISVIQIDHTGTVHNRYSVRGKGIRLPAKQMLRWYCKKLYESYYNLLIDNVEGKEQRTNPVHKGWFSICGIPRYAGLSYLRAETEVITLSEFLRIAPYEITLPLFSYSLFSALKYFIFGYPARLSDREPYHTAVSKLGKTIFLSITGDEARTFAKIFCGAFAGDTAQYSIKQPQITNRIHDGVVIYDTANNDLYHISERRLPQFLMHDACSLFLNARLPESSRGMITVDVSGATAPQNRSPSSAYFLKPFILWVEGQYQKQMERAKKNAVNQFAKCFSEHYKRAAYAHGICLSKQNIDPLIEEVLNEIPETIDLDMLHQFFVWRLYRYFKDLDEKLIKRNTQKKGLFQEPVSSQGPLNAIPFDGIYSKAVRELAMRKPSGLPALESTIRKNPTAAAYEYSGFILGGRKICSNQRKGLKIDIVDYDAALKILKGALGVDPHLAKSHALLMASFFTFLDFYSEICPNDAGKLRTEGQKIFLALCRKESTLKYRTNAIQIFSQYLSELLEKNQILGVRMESTQESAPTGWYDAKRNQIYLPYATYFENFCFYCSQQKIPNVPRSKREFQENILYPENIMLLKQNGSNTSYLRPDYKLVVAPVCEMNPPKETVIKIDVAQLERISPLSFQAHYKFKQFKNVAVARRISRKGRGKYEG